VPTANPEVMKVAVPVLSRVAFPRDIAPSMKVTVPDGTPPPPPEALTTAVKVTTCPKTLGFAELETVLVVGL